MICGSDRVPIAPRCNFASKRLEVRSIAQQAEGRHGRLRSPEGPCRTSAGCVTPKIARPTFCAPSDPASTLHEAEAGFWITEGCVIATHVAMRWKLYPTLMITQRDKCRVRAREYEQLARFCSDRDTELLYRKLANEWRELATLIEL